MYSLWVAGIDFRAAAAVILCLYYFDLHANDEALRHRHESLKQQSSSMKVLIYSDSFPGL